MPKSKPDNGLRRVFRQYLREGVAWTTVETGMVQLGVPDSNYLLTGGVEGWIEYKATDAFAVKFQPEQIGWLSRRARYGGRAWIAIRRQHAGGARLGDPVDELYMVPVRHLMPLVEHGLACGHARLVGEQGPARWRWPVVRKLMAA